MRDKEIRERDLVPSTRRYEQREQKETKINKGTREDGRSNAEDTRSPGRIPYARKTRKKRIDHGLGCISDRTSFLIVASRVTGRADRNDHLRSSGWSSLPQSSSISVCSFNCFIPMLQRIPAIEIPSTTCQTTFSAIPNVFRTSSFNGW